MSLHLFAIAIFSSSSGLCIYLRLSLSSDERYDDRTWPIALQGCYDLWWSSHQWFLHSWMWRRPRDSLIYSNARVLWSAYVNNMLAVFLGFISLGLATFRQRVTTIKSVASCWSYIYCMTVLAESVTARWHWKEDLKSGIEDAWMIVYLCKAEWTLALDYVPFLRQKRGKGRSLAVMRLAIGCTQTPTQSLWDCLRLLLVDGNFP